MGWEGKITVPSGRISYGATNQNCSQDSNVNSNCDHQISKGDMNNTMQKLGLENKT